MTVVHSSYSKVYFLGDTPRIILFLVVVIKNISSSNVEIVESPLGT